MIVTGAVTGPTSSTCSARRPRRPPSTTGPPADSRSFGSGLGQRGLRGLVPCGPTTRCAVIAAQRGRAEHPVAMPAAPRIRPTVLTVLRPGTRSRRCRRLVRGAPSTDVPARDPGADPGDDLVVDRAAGVGPLSGGGLAAVAGAEDDHLVAGGDRVVAAVDDELVHRDPTRRSAGAGRRARPRPPSWPPAGCRRRTRAGPTPASSRRRCGRSARTRRRTRPAPAWSARRWRAASSRGAARPACAPG